MKYIFCSITFAILMNWKIVDGSDILGKKVFHGVIFGDQKVLYTLDFNSSF